MKEFIVNDRRLASIECDASMDSCPVFHWVFDKDNKEMPLFATTYNDKTGIRMETVPDMAHKLRRVVVGLCRNCNVRGR